MFNEAEFWVETGALVAALLLIPFYMGYIHVGPGGALVYTLTGALGMTLGEQLQFPGSEWPSPNELMTDLVLWGAAISGAGGVTYVLALILV